MGHPEGSPSVVVDAKEDAPSKVDAAKREACEEIVGWACDLCPPGKCDSVTLSRLLRVVSPPPWRSLATDPPTQQMADEDWVMLIGDKPTSIPLPGGWDNEDQCWVSFNRAVEGVRQPYRVFRPVYWRPIDRPVVVALEAIHDDTINPSGRTETPSLNPPGGEDHAD